MILSLPTNPGFLSVGCVIYSMFQRVGFMSALKPKSFGSKNSTYSLYLVTTLIKRHGIRYHKRKRWVPATTDSKHNPNLLNRNFHAVKGNCWDNAPMESFFSSLKTECVHRTRFKTFKQAKAALFDYI